MNGWKGTILRVNLSQGKITKQLLNEDLAHMFGGGRGLNSKIFFDEVKPGTDPLGPDNKVIIGTGPCNGTIVPGSQRFTVTAKSPLTGIWNDSNAGGTLGAELKYAGYDHVIIEGKSPKPVYLWIDDDKVELKPAEHLWGKTTREARRIIERDIGDPEICAITIGQGGENLVRFSCIISDLGRALGRSGMGAVFGSKNLKAVVVRGTGGVKVADSRLLEDLFGQVLDGWRKRLAFWQEKAKYGLSGRWSEIYESRGMLPSKNFQSGVWKNLLEPLGEHFVKPKAGFSCPTPCDHLTVVGKGPYAGAFLDGFELSQIGDYGARVGVEDLGIALKADALCDEYGLDFYDMAAITSYVMECFQRGIMTTEDTGGLKVEWGDDDAILNLIEMTVNRKGIGDILAQGLKEASETIGRGSEKYALHVKGRTPTMREPRASKGWGLMYAVANRGACHVRALLPEGEYAGGWDSMLTEDLKKYKDPFNPLKEEAKGFLTKWHEDLVTFKNCMEICLFSLYPWMFEEPSVAKMMAKLYNSVTGLNLGGKDVLTIGERVYNLEKAFNVMEGATRKDDSLPDRFTKEPMPDGAAKGQTVKLEPMLDEYYESRGWDKTTSFPTRKKLSELGLDDVADKLERIGKLR